MSGSLSLRPADTGDAAAIAAVYAPYVLGSVASFEQEPPHGEEVARRMLVGPRKPWWLAEREGTVVGYAYASAYRSRPAYRWSVETSVYLTSTEHRQGTGSALYARLIADVTALGYMTAYAGITLPNPGSVGLHERLGFTRAGVFHAAGFKDGAWHDTGWWQLSLREPPDAPAEPTPWSPERADCTHA